MNNICVVFDLDDTLYKEIDFLNSGFYYIASKLCNSSVEAQRLVCCMNEYRLRGENVFNQLALRFSEDARMEDLLLWYRFHIPNIKIPANSLSVLQYLKQHKITIGIITDGRSVTQRNKIKALGINKFVDDNHIIISEEFGSEKPDWKNYQYFENLHPQINKFFYIADNPLKDFIAPML